MLMDLAKLAGGGWRGLWLAKLQATLLNKDSLYTSAPLADQDVVNAVLAEHPECVSGPW